ncbi:MAG: cytochrome c [Rubrobacteridae bacterium]|nr:cytochrome c [Rubrobacteridae bacterium]
MKWLLATAIALIIIGIIGLTVVNYYSFSPIRPGISRLPYRGPGSVDGFRRGPSENGFSSNGEQIFFTGASSKNTITTTGGPHWFQMHGGGCASCHGPDGRGGHIAMMGSFEAPNITYDVLAGKASDEHEHKPYTDSLIKRAIATGIDSSGDQLDQNMPRWKMTDRDVNDVIGYLKTLEP